MSAETKLAARLHDAFFAGEGLRIGKAVWAALVDEVKAAGWASPEEATAREAAARREALLEAREDLVAELVCCDVYERLSGKSTTAWTPEERNEYQHHSICYWGSASAELVRALAEPERAEEGDMLGGDPNFKHRDATVPMDDDFPSEVARALLDDERLSDEAGQP